MPYGQKDPDKTPAGMRHMTKKPKSSGKGGYARSTMGTGRNGADRISGAMGKNQKTGNGEAF